MIRFCRPICGGDGDMLAAKPGANIKNKDTCIAVAGLPSNNTIAIRKYCVPKTQGKGVRGVPTETWFVWFSEEWTDTLVDLQFLDTWSGDAVAALRDNKGRSLETGPMEQFVSVHPRVIQQDTSLYDRIYGTRQNRVDRLMLAKMSSEFGGMDPSEQQVLAITEMFVLPTSEGDRRRPWVFLSLIVSPQDEQPPIPATTDDEDQAYAASYRESSANLENSIHESKRVDVCICLDMNTFVGFAGIVTQTADRCNLNSFFEINRNSGYNAVVLHKPNSLLKADIALLPSQKGADACILHLRFETLSKLSDEQAKSCFTTPDSFSTNANFPLRSSWSDMQREMFLGAENMNGGTGGMQMSREGVMYLAHRIVAQNSLSSMDLSVDSAASGNNLRINLFATGDPGASTHWLKQIRIAVHTEGTNSDGSLKPRSVTSRSMHSQEVQTKVITYHSCDRKSCLGCATLNLQALCYAAQQCSVVSCIGTVVNQVRIYPEL